MGVIIPIPQPSTVLADDADLTAAITLSTFTDEGVLTFAITGADASGGSIAIEGENADGTSQSETLKFTAAEQTLTATKAYVETNLTVTPSTFTQGTADVSVQTVENYEIYKARMQTGRDILSPDITVRFTAAQIPDAVFSEAGALLIAETQVMTDSGETTADIQALAADSNDLLMLVHATLIRRAIGLLPQAAQMLREGILGDSRQYQEIDWEARKAQLENDYQSAVKVVNASAVFETVTDFGLPTVLTTKSE